MRLDRPICLQPLMVRLKKHSGRPRVCVCRFFSRIPRALALGILLFADTTLMGYNAVAVLSEGPSPRMEDRAGFAYLLGTASEQARFGINSAILYENIMNCWSD